MADWKSRLVVKYTDASGQATLTPIDSFTPSFALNAEVMHSVEDTHVGVIYNPQSISFSLSVKAIGDAAARLTALALQGKRFEILLQEQDGGTDWSFRTVVMSECIITSATPSTATISGAPAATFSGFALSSAVTGKTTPAITVP
jgi:hypothetical protein